MEKPPESVSRELIITETVAGFVAGVVPGFIFSKAVSRFILTETRSPGIVKSTLNVVGIRDPNSVFVLAVIFLTGCLGAYYRYQHTAHRARKRGTDTPDR